jgi:hypothetical protein
MEKGATTSDQAHLNQNPWIICYDCATQHNKAKIQTGQKAKMSILARAQNMMTYNLGR